MPDFLYDYVALRKMGVRSLTLFHEVPVGEDASLSADLDLHCEGPAGAQRCAARRGVVLSQNAQGTRPMMQFADASARVIKLLGRAAVPTAVHCPYTL